MNGIYCRKPPVLLGGILVLQIGICQRIHAQLHSRCSIFFCHLFRPLPVILTLHLRRGTSQVWSHAQERASREMRKANRHKRNIFSHKIIFIHNSFSKSDKFQS